ncbi:class II aldolase/adducin family protein [Cohnella terricola]|uniref:Class II aldolase/adducin family protein n=1 Tax=Cohnella terricola TaxID=1289167 RepID=A0A559JQ08_9BACL|nr:class II aldolase/adducin family protein [Cohnella terricola]TVY01976.1 class II aldolase/adducin family protein [Cohnella terricola]
MRYDLLHPADQILLMMDRIYGYGMTTTSGGNLSILDEENNIWITPAGIDKGSLTRNDIVCVKADGTIVGHHRPSSEFPFHRLIYDARPDLRAVVHAHPPALVSFSIVRRIPDTRLLPNERQICGEIDMATYALPGSRELGENIASVFKRGINAVMLENHGVVVGGTDLFQAFQCFETLDFCARLEINARRIGTPSILSDEQFLAVKTGDGVDLETFEPTAYGTEERAIRRDMCVLIKRAYDQRLFTSTQGTFSQRLADGSFVITPYGSDRKYLEPEDLVRIENGASEAGKIPSRSVRLHQEIYEMHPHINSVIIAHPPNVMAFAVTDNELDSRTIPESYILMRNAPKLAFDAVYGDTEATAARFTKDTPIAIVENNCAIVTGQSLLNAFDRLEVAEYSAKALLSAICLGDIVNIDQNRIRELEIAFKL